MRAKHIVTLFVFGFGCAASRAVPPSAKATTACPQGAGARMVRLPLGFCVDATEVTRAAYADWLSTTPATSEQIPACNWNTSFVPPQGWPASETDPNLPVTWVDWCDASAYCKAVGKHLCGKPTEQDDAHGYARESQLYAACSSNDAHQYSYGNTYDAATCNTADTGNGRPVAVGTLLGCQSSTPGYTGIYDLSGNVWEWTDNCHGGEQQGGPSTYCSLKGGSFSLVGQYSRCAYPHSAARNNPSADVGFRCCAL